MTVQMKNLIKNSKKQGSRIGCYSKGTVLEYITYRQEKQKPQIDFLRFLCYNISESEFI